MGLELLLQGPDDSHFLSEQTQPRAFPSVQKATGKRVTDAGLEHVRRGWHVAVEGLAPLPFGDGWGWGLVGGEMVVLVLPG